MDELVSLQDIKERYANVKPIEIINGINIIAMSEADKDLLIEEIELLQFENETIRRNRTTQERKDFNRIKQLENEIKSIKSVIKVKLSDHRFEVSIFKRRNQELETANTLLHLENKEYEKALKFYAKKENYECDDETLNPAVSYIHIVDMDSGEMAREALGEAIVEELNSQSQND